jgi:hypothetical protein
VLPAEGTALATPTAMDIQRTRSHRLGDVGRRRRFTSVSRLVWLTGLLGALSVASFAQAPAPVAPNESVVTARVTGAVVVEAASLGIAPAQPLCALTLDVLSVKAAGDVLPAIKATDKTVRVYTKNVDLVRLKGATITAAITLRGDERRGLLWLVRLDDSKVPR